MSVDIKKMYYLLNKKEFEQYITNLKNSSDCISFLNNNYYFIADAKVMKLIGQLNNLQTKLDYQFETLTEFQKSLVLQSCVIDEVQSTNKTENIYSTRSDVFGLIKNVKSIKNKKIASSVHSYNAILNAQQTDVNSLEDLREIYDALMEDCYESSRDYPDGLLFRKGMVYINDGLNVVHTGFYPEEEIIEGMKEYLKLTARVDLDIYTRVILSHFMIETIHPFYDGNGRLGRLLASMLLYQNQKTFFALCVSKAIYNKKSKYYKALEEGKKIHSFGFVNESFILLAEIFLDEMENMLNHLIDCKQQLLKQREKIKEFDFTKTEALVYDLLLQASCYSYFGLSNEDIMHEIKISKRTMIHCTNRFKNLNIIDDLKLGKNTYHRIKECGLRNDD